MSDAKLATMTPISPAAAPAIPSTIAIADTSANPAPLGLLCFALTTVLLSAHNAGLIALDAAIVAMAVFYGGAAQIIAGIIVFPKLGLADKPSGTTMAVYLGLWGLISFILFIGTLRLNRALQVVFFLLWVAFALLALGDLTGISALTKLGGWEGMLLGFAAMYTGLAQVLNEVYGRRIWPLGPVTK